MKWFKEKKVLITLLGFLAIGTVGITTAFFSAGGSKVNIIKTGKIEVGVTEKVIEGKKMDVGASVTADSAACWVRIFVGMPKGMQGNALLETTPKEPDENWIKDGEYYYYNTTLGGTGEEETVILFNEIKSLENLSKDQASTNLDIIVYAEAIQKEYGASAKEAFENVKK